MGIKQLRNILMENPQLARDIIAGDIIPFTGDDMSRVLNKCKDRGFNVTVEVDDDNLTPEERERRDADLADKAIHILMSRGGKGIT